MEEGHREIEIQPINSATVNSTTISLENEVRQVRNELIVAAALIAAATYQALLSPPEAIEHGAPLVAFICANTLAFSSSVTIIEYMSESFPYQREIRLCYITFGLSAGMAAGSHIRGTGAVSVIILLVCWVTPILIRSLPKLWKRICPC